MPRRTCRNAVRLPPRRRIIFRNTFDVFDFVPGGTWRFTMHAPDGTSYPNESVFLAVEPNRRIVVRHRSKPYFELAVTLERSAAGTLVTWEQAFNDPDVAASMKHIVEPANEQNLTRWQAELERGGNGIV